MHTATSVYDDEKTCVHTARACVCVCVSRKFQISYDEAHTALMARCIDANIPQLSNTPCISGVIRGHRTLAVFRSLGFGRAVCGLPV